MKSIHFSFTTVIRYLFTFCQFFRSPVDTMLESLADLQVEKSWVQARSLRQAEARPSLVKGGWRDYASLVKGGLLARLCFPSHGRMPWAWIAM
jgi:hypothetical protein